MRQLLISRRDLVAGSIVSSLCAAISPATPAAPTLRIQRLAWAGIRLELPGATLFIDPLIDKEIWGEALSDPIIPVDDAKGDVFVLVTHRHPDHSDPKAIAAALRGTGTIVYPAETPPFHGLAPGVRERPSPLWEPQILGDFTATPVPASDGYGDPQVSWVVAAGGRRIFHGGDTMMHGNWWRIGRQFGGFDAAFLPINGARFSWRQPASDAPAVLTPPQAISAATILGAARIVPIHYGVRGADGYAEVDSPLEVLTAAGKPESLRIYALAPGDWLEW